MSAILASIADAERLAGYDPDCTLIDGTCARATAARAEHAEMVAIMQRSVRAIGCACVVNDGEACDDCLNTLEHLDTLLSRVGGGA